MGGGAPGAAPQPAQWQTNDMVQLIEPSAKAKASKKNLSDDSTVTEVFGLRAPNRLMPDKAEEFIKYNNLYIANPYRFQDTKTLVGLEIEVENVLHINPNIPLGFWEIAEDGSLRNNGREFKTVALPLNYAEYALRQLADGLNDTVDFSVRTSVHVHQDVRGMTLNQLVCLLLTYCAVENLLFKFAGNNRRNSIYCVPLRETDLLEKFQTKLGMAKSLRNINMTWHKYTAFNLLPIMTFGTVEYRHMPGTLDVKRLLVWLDLLSRLKVFAYKVDYETLSNSVCELNTNSAYRHFVEKVFGEAIEYLDTRSLQEDMEKNVYLVKHACIANDFHQKVVTAPFDSKSKLGQKYTVRAISHYLNEQQIVLFQQWADKYHPGLGLDELYDIVKQQPRDFLMSCRTPQDQALFAKAIGYKIHKYKPFAEEI